MYFAKRFLTTIVVAAGLLIPFMSFAATLEECKAARDDYYAKGLEFFVPLAQKGDAMAQFLVGFSYGDRIPPDRAEQVKWYLKAAEQGNSCAQNGIGILYANGWGVPKDSSEAARWYRRAADQGHSMAQYNLGVLYQQGYGVKKDLIEAERWFRKSADQGNEAGRSALQQLEAIRKK